MTQRTALFTALFALALLSGAPGLRAANPPAGQPQDQQSKPGEQSGDQPAEQPGESNPEEPDLASILAAFAKAKTGLADAVATAEKEAGGGKAVDATFEPGEATPVYRVTVYRNNALWEGLYDADTGKATGSPSMTNESELDDQEKKELASVTDAKASLLDAIKTAETEVGGKTVDAGIEEHDGKVWYQIAVVKNGAVQPVLVDPATGKAQPQSAAPPPAQK